MCELEIKFRITDEDIFEFNNIVSRRGRRFSSVISFALLTFLLMKNIISEERSYTVIIFIVLMMALMLFAKSYASKRSFKKQYKDYFLLKTDIVMEFYKDHIVQKNESGETEIRFEDHYPLEAIKNVIETDEHFMFCISPLEALIVPKRAFDEENMKKMNHFMRNIFCEVYRK